MDNDYQQDNQTYEATIETMYGHCASCNRDYSLWLIGVYVEGDDEPIETFVRCSHCGYQED